MTWLSQFKTECWSTFIRLIKHLKYFFLRFQRQIFLCPPPPEKGGILFCNLINSKLVQGLPSMSQRSKSNYSSKPTVLFILYILILCLPASDRFCFYRKLCTMEAYMFLKYFLSINPINQSINHIFSIFCWRKRF